jgi:hypothetical protein
MPSLEEQTGPDTIAGNAGAQSLANTKMGADVQNTLANNPNQSDNDTPPSSKELFDAEQSVGKGAVEDGDQQENKEANPDDLTTAPAPPTDSTQPNVYGGNFGNDVQNSFQDHDRASNQRADANRGELGQQEYNKGATHGGYGNQFREINTAAEHPAAEATEEKYYGQGASRPGAQHNAYRAYDGRDLAPAQQGHAVADTPAARVSNFDTQPDTAAAERGNTRDTRNDVGETGPGAAFQNDNGAPTVGPAYADDYGHTSGVSLPTNTPSHHLPMAPDGHGLGTDPASARGGYDGQQSEATTSKQGSAPAPVNSPDAPQGEGYCYGHQRSEQEQAGNPKTGDSRNGFGPAGSQEGNTSQGHGSQGGSYDDENPGARGPAYDNFTQEDKATNYGQAKREESRPADGDQPADADHGAPRRNAGRDEEN